MRVLIGLVGVMLLGAPAWADDLDLGKKAARQCVVCHGKLGVAKDPEVPNIAGQSAFYLEKSLKEYRDGTREDRRMTLIAKNLDDEKIRALAAWYAAFKIEVTAPE